MWHVARSLDVLRDEINKSAPNRSKASDGSIGDPAHASRTSDHNPCDHHEAVCARDITHDPAGGFDSYKFADWLRVRCATRTEWRVKYIISNRRIASPREDWMWRAYTGSNPHDHHVHISVEHGPDVYEDASTWGWGAPAPIPKPPTPVVDPAWGGMEQGDLMFIATFGSPTRTYMGNGLVFRLLDDDADVLRNIARFKRAGKPLRDWMTGQVVDARDDVTKVASIDELGILIKR